MSSRQTLRQKIIQQRFSLTAHQRVYAAERVAAHLINSTLFLRAQRLAFYLPVKGELDPFPVVEHALSMKKSLYLPVLHPLHHNRLYFMPWKPEDPLVKNRYGISEPVLQTQKVVPPWSLDLVLAPLVAFDLKGNRLGMGGGYYDRTFSFLNRRKSPDKPPYLIGMAYEFQKMDSLSQAAWDVPLTKVVTEKNIYGLRV